MGEKEELTVKKAPPAAMEMMEDEEEGQEEQQEEELEDIEYASIMIATEDSIKNSFLLDKLTQHSFPLLLVGRTGTGKTRLVKKYISKL